MIKKLLLKLIFNRTELKAIHNSLIFHSYIIELRKYNIDKNCHIDLNLPIEKQDKIIDNNMTEFFGYFNDNVFKSKKFVNVSKSLISLFKISLLKNIK